MQILNSENFKKDYKTIQNFIEQSSDDQVKNQVKSLLSELITHVRNIDNIHNDLALVSRLSDKTQESRNRIADLRKKIFKIIESN